MGEVHVHLLKPSDSLIENISKKLSREIEKDPLSLTQFLTVLPSRRLYLYILRKISLLSGKKFFPAPKQTTLSELPFHLLEKLGLPVKQASQEDLIRIFIDFLKIGKEEISSKEDLLWLLEVAHATEKILHTLNPKEEKFPCKKLCESLSSFPFELYVRNKIVKRFWRKLKETSCSGTLLDELILLTEKHKAFSPALASHFLLKNLPQNSGRIRETKLIFAGVYFLTPLQRELLKELASLLIESHIFLKKIPSLANPGDHPRENNPVISNLKIFLTKITGKEIDERELTESLTETEFPEVVEIHSPSRIKLTQFISKLIIQKKTPSNPDEIAIIVPEDASLEPLLSSLEKVTQEENKELKINISMGLPASRSSSFSLLKLISKTINETFSDGKNLVFYTEDLLSLVDNPLIGDGPFLHSEIDPAASVQKIPINKLKNLEKETKGGWGKIIEILLEATHRRNKITLREATELILELLERVYKNTDLRNSDPIKEEASFLSSIVDALKNAENSAIANLSLPTREAFSYIIHNLGKIRTPFSGEPLSGLQILGLLETRSLDFEEIFLLDAHEGILPAVNNYDPVIPKFIREELKLMDPRTESAIYEVNFLSLILKTKRVYISYTNAASKSRFIEKLRYMMEIAGKGNLFSCEEIPAVESSESDFIKIEKVGTPIISKSNTVYPTLFDSYVGCPLKAFLTEIVEAEPPESYLLPSHFLGTIAHLIFEEVFLKVKQKLPPLFQDKIYLNSTYALSELKTEIEGHEDLLNIAEFFKHKKPDEDNLNQMIEFLKKVPKTLRKLSALILWEKIQKILGKENKLYRDSKSNIKITAILLEQPLEKSIKFHTSEGKQEIILRGKADRIQLEEIDGKKIVNIIDYKTGGFPNPRNINSVISDLKEQSPQSCEEFIEFLARKGGSLQLLSYLWLFINSDLLKEYIQDKSTLPYLGYSIFSLKKERIIKKYSSPEEVQEGYKQVLKPLIEAMLQGYVIPSPNKYDICKYCPFKWVCKQEKSSH